MSCKTLYEPATGHVNPILFLTKSKPAENLNERYPDYISDFHQPLKTERQIGPSLTAMSGRHKKPQLSAGIIYDPLEALWGVLLFDRFMTTESGL